MIIGTRTKAGIAIPQSFLDGPADAALISRHAARAESLGYDSLWVQHGVFSTPLDPFVLLAAAATATSRVKLGVSVVVLPLFHPLHVAKTVASLDQLSQGRIILGVGLGGHEARYPIFGIDPARRVRRFTDSLELIKRLWTEDEVSFDNGEWRVDGLTLGPKPVQQPHPPIWFGARAEAAVKRAVRLGDGFMGAGASRMDSFLKLLGSLRKRLDEANRDSRVVHDSEAALYRHRRRQGACRPRASPLLRPPLPERRTWAPGRGVGLGGRGDGTGGAPRRRRPRHDHVQPHLRPRRARRTHRGADRAAAVGWAGLRPLLYSKRWAAIPS